MSKLVFRSRPTHPRPSALREALTRLRAVIRSTVNLVGITTQPPGVARLRDITRARGTLTVLGPVGSPAYPHEPTGYTPFLSYNGNCIVGIGSPCGEIGAWLWSNGYAADAANISSVTAADAPTNQQDPLHNVLETRFPTGQAPGYAPVHLGGWNALFTNQIHQREIYLSMWVQIVGPDYEAYPGVNKFGFFGYGTGSGIDISNDGFFDLRPPVQGGPNGVIVTQMTLEFQQQNNVTRQINTGTSMSVGPWHRWELVLKLNTLGSANGVLQWWHDGVQIANLSDMVFITPGNTNGFYSYAWQPYWGGGSGGQNPKVRTDYVRTDQLYISGKPLILPGFYVAPSAGSTGTGTFTNPWPLATALAGASGAIHPGDTVWLRGGTYAGSFTSVLTGTVASPIIVRSYPGERPIISNAAASSIGNCFTINGSDTWYEGFEITHTNPNSVDVAGIMCYGPRTKLINLIVHDFSGVGIGLWVPATDAELYGCISYYNGFTGSDPGISFGHGLYTQNDTGTKLYRENIIGANYGYGYHCFAETAAMRNLQLTGNVSFNNREGGIVMRSNTTPVSGNVIDQFLTYGGFGFVGKDNNTTADQQDITITNSYIAGGRVDIGRFTSFVNFSNNIVRGASVASKVQFYIPLAGLTLPNPPGYVWNNNDYLLDAFLCGGSTLCPFGIIAANGSGTNYSSLAAWRSATGFDAQSTLVQNTSGKPATTVTFVRPNVYERGRGHVIVYNWGGLSSVSVDLSTVLSVGDAYNIFNVQTILGAPVLSGTYAGGSVSIPITAVSPPAPLGTQVRPSITFPSTGIEYHVFVVRLQGA